MLYSLLEYCGQDCLPTRILDSPWQGRPASNELRSAECKRPTSTWQTRFSPFISAQRTCDSGRVVATRKLTHYLSLHVLNQQLPAGRQPVQRFSDCSTSSLLANSFRSASSRPFVTSSICHCPRATNSRVSFLERGIRYAAPNLTDTSFETPGSCMVTPYSTGAMLMVLLLCVIRMNWVCTLISRTRSVKRAMFASSSGASTSSRIQNGLGVYWKIPTSSASAVSAFSPPESRSTFCNFFPGGDATTSMPLSALFSRSVSRMKPCPPPNSLRNVAWKFSLIRLNASSNF